MEEQASREILDHDTVMEGLQKECDNLVAGKGHLEEEIKGLRLGKKEFDEAKARSEALDQDFAGSKAAEGLALERARKVNETAENLRKEIDAEKASSAALVVEVDSLIEEAT